MLSQTVEYALRAAVFLASRDGVPVTNEEVAERTKVPAAYLAKILQGLSRAGVVKSQRGVGGGVMLLIDPRELTILQVVNAVEPIQRITICPLGLPTHGSVLCPLHKKLDTAIAAVQEAFGTTTLADILAEPSTSVPLCDFPIDDERIPLPTRKR